MNYLKKALAEHSAQQKIAMPAENTNTPRSRKGVVTNYTFNNQIKKEKNNKKENKSKKSKAKDLRFYKVD